MYDGVSFSLIKEFESDFEKFKDDFVFLFEMVVYFLRDVFMFKKINFVEFIINIDKLEKIVEFVNKYIIFYIYRLL